MTSSAIEFQQVSKSFGDACVIGEVTASIGRGEFVAILGPSGSGKSTLLNMVAGLETPTLGDVTTWGESVRGPGPDRGVVFQDHALLPWLSARGNIDFGLRSARPELSAEERTKLSDVHLDNVNLTHAAHRRPQNLSGGMQQRVGIARAFAIGSPILLLDEPFGALDALTRRQLQDLLQDVWKEDRRTVLMVTHDVEEALLLATRILVMSPGPKASIVADVVPKDTSRAQLLGLLDNT